MADRGRRSDGIRVARAQVTGRVGASLPTAEQRAYDWLWLDRTLRSERASEQNADRSIGIDLACYRHGVLLQERRGTPVPIAGEQSSPLGIPSHRTARRGFGTRVAARKKKRPPILANWGPCCVTSRRVHARGMAVGESHGTAGPCGQRHQLRSAVKPNSQPKSLARRDRNRFRSLQGRVTTATPMPKRHRTSCMALRQAVMKAV